MPLDPLGTSPQTPFGYCFFFIDKSFLVLFFKKELLPAYSVGARAIE
jgi:hypothetical protein